MTTNRIRYDAGAPHAPAADDAWAGGISDDVDDLVASSTNVAGDLVRWVYHGTDATVARPVTDPDVFVWWVGTVEPQNWLDPASNDGKVSDALVDVSEVA